MVTVFGIDQNVIVSAKTHILRAQLNCRVDIGDTTQVSYIDVFIVSLRKEVQAWVSKATMRGRVSYGSLRNLGTMKRKYAKNIVTEEMEAFEVYRLS